MRGTPAGRVDAVDVARGVALVGMMLVHLTSDPPWGDMIAAGRAAPLFAMLAGVALSLVHRRDPHGVGSVRATCGRAVLLIAMGLSLGSLDDMPVYVILAYYGLMIVVALPFRRLGTRVLLAVAIAWTVLAPILLLWLQVENVPHAPTQTELSDVQHPWSLLTKLLVWGAYPCAVWFAYVLVGLLVGRLDLTDARVAVGLVLGGGLMLAVALGIGSIGIARGVFDDWSVRGWRQLFEHGPYPFDVATWNELWLVGEHTSRPLNVVSAIGSALLVIGLCAVLVGTPWLRVYLEPLRAAGAMTLTLYTVHVLWTWRYATRAADELVPTAQLTGWDVWFLQVAVLLAAATLWQRFVGRGPLESVVRLLSVPRRTRKNAPV